MRLRDLLVASEMREIGSYEFTAERIVEFASNFDPHHFHLDAEKAKQSLFGGLCASGWHVCAAAMKCNVAFITAESKKISAEGGTPPKLGPSPGIRDLKWLKPVFAGDVVHFALRFNHDAPVPGKPGWRICNLTYFGRNQRSEPILQFDCHVVEFE